MTGHQGAGLLAWTNRQMDQETSVWLIVLVLSLFHLIVKIVDYFIIGVCHGAFVKNRG